MSNYSNNLPIYFANNNRTAQQPMTIVPLPPVPKSAANNNENAVEKKKKRRSSVLGVPAEKIAEMAANHEQYFRNPEDDGMFV